MIMHKFIYSITVKVNYPCRNASTKDKLVLFRYIHNIEKQFQTGSCIKRCKAVILKHF
jgi:hypothetical protein